MLSRRKIGKRGVSAAPITVCQVRPQRLRHAFEDEFAHSAWGVDVWLTDTSTLAVLLYTLVNRQAIKSSGNVWKENIRRRHQSGTESEWLPEEEVRGSFTPLQLDVFHAP